MADLKKGDAVMIVAMACRRRGASEVSAITVLTRGRSDPDGQPQRRDEPVVLEPGRVRQRITAGPDFLHFGKWQSKFQVYCAGFPIWSHAGFLRSQDVQFKKVCCIFSLLFLDCIAALCRAVCSAHAQQAAAPAGAGGGAASSNLQRQRRHLQQQRPRQRRRLEAPRCTAWWRIRTTRWFRARR